MTLDLWFLALLAVLWLASIVWGFVDANRRNRDDQATERARGRMV